MHDIVIIDSDKASGDLAARLRRKGFKSSWAAGAEEGLALVMRLKPDLVLLDVDQAANGMPHMIEEIHELSPHTAVLVSSDAVDGYTVVECMRKGALDFLVRPFTTGKLIGSIERIRTLRTNMCIGLTPSTECVVTERKTLIVSNDIRDLPYTINQAVLNAGAVCKDIEMLKMALGEILINAVEHGNLGITMEEKALTVKNGGFERLVHKKLRDPKLSARKVTLDVIMDTGRLEYIVTDEGDGFDYRKKTDPDPEVHVGSGLGIQIAKSFFHEVRYEGKGNRVHLVYLHEGKKTRGKPLARAGKTHVPQGSFETKASAGGREAGPPAGMPDMNVIVQLTRSFPMGILLVEDKDRIAVWNEKAEQLTSIKAADLLGLRVVQAPSLIRGLLDGSGPHVSLPCDDIETRVLEKTLHTLEDGSGRRFSVALFSDVTQAMRRKEELERLLIESAETKDLMEEQAARLAITLAEMDEKNEIIKAQNQRMIGELEMAARLQKSLLPDTFENMNGVSFSCKYIPSIHIGGDLYDVVDLGGGQSGFIIADVSGHGVAAALISAMFKMSFHALAATVASPTILMHMLNRELRPVLDEDYITAFFVITDRFNKSVSYTNAGHPTPLLYKRSSGTIKELDTDGFFLGSFDDGGYGEGIEPAIENGDALLMYTDCIIETENPSGDQYGKERLKRCLAGLLESKRGNEVVEAIEADVRAFAAGKSLDDDLTIMLLEFWDEVGLSDPVPDESGSGGFVEF
jgi:serine phosphatase RsbU (regulator of sigma subunit)/response regulator of citrate/malate metabolism